MFTQNLGPQNLCYLKGGVLVHFSFATLIYAIRLSHAKG